MSTISESGFVRRLAAVTAAVASTGLLLAACSSSPSGTPSVSGNSTTTTSSAGGNSSTSTSASSNPGTSAAAKLAALSESVQSAKGGSFKLQYTEASSASGGSHTLLFEQMPPKYLFSLSGSSSVLVVNTGHGLYTCSSQGTQKVCVLVPSAAEFAPLLNVLTGATVVTAFNGLRSGLAAKLAGVSATFSSATFAGQSAQCVSGVKAGNSFKYCVTNSGVLAYAGGSSSQSFGSVSLTSYSTSVSASDFSLPVGATVVTS